MLNFHRMPVTDRRNGGVITNAAVMTMTSGPERTKPITRGAWLAGVIFNNPPEPPPADVSAARRKPSRRRRTSDPARTARDAPRACRLQRLPRADRSARLCAGELRRRSAYWRDKYRQRPRGRHGGHSVPQAPVHETSSNSRTPSSPRKTASPGLSPAICSPSPSPANSAPPISSRSTKSPQPPPRTTTRSRPCSSRSS